MANAKKYFLMALAVLLLLFEALLISCAISPSSYYDVGLINATVAWNDNPSPETESGLTETMWRLRRKMAILTGVTWGLIALNAFAIVKVTKTIREGKGTSSLK
jgi:hypothetical protein